MAGCDIRVLVYIRRHGGLRCCLNCILRMLPAYVCLPGMPSLRSCMPGYGLAGILVGCHLPENVGVRLYVCFG